MRRNIVSNDCKNMFADKFNSLTMKEIGTELKHFAMGTAPESPSFLVNQDELKKTLIEKFSKFFDKENSQGLEIIYLKSNYGNGKSHFIRTIYSFLCEFENVYVKQISLKQETTDLKIKILGCVGQKIIKEAADYFINSVAEKIGQNEKDPIILSLNEELNISSNLSQLLYQAAKDEDISVQARAVSVLRGNYLNDYLKTLGLKKNDLNDTFYFDVIRLICSFLYEHNCYLVIVFDEYEHVYSWKSEKARKVFFSDIKYFTDNIDTYKNLFLAFAESESADSRTEVTDDPAYASRKKNTVFSIEDISSDMQINRLFKMIKKRYEKYYGISLDMYMEEMLECVKTDSQVKSNSNYRNYTQVIMRVLDQYKNPAKKQERLKIKRSHPKDTKKITSNEQSVPLTDKWGNLTSISKKTFMCELLEKILDKSNEHIIFKSRRKGIYHTIKEGKTVEYRIIVTNSFNVSHFNKTYNDLLRIQSEGEIEEFTLLYPYMPEINHFQYDNVIFYDIDNIPNKTGIVEDVKTVEDVYSFLKKNLEWG